MFYRIIIHLELLLKILVNEIQMLRKRRFFQLVLSTFYLNIYY